MNHRCISAICAALLVLSVQQRAMATDVPDTERTVGRWWPVAPHAVIAPTPGMDDHVAIVTAAGFAPQEAITFRFGLVDPFTGGIANPVFTISGMAEHFGRLSDQWGNVPVPPQALPASLPLVDSMFASPAAAAVARAHLGTYREDEEQYPLVGDLAVQLRAAGLGYTHW